MQVIRLYGGVSEVQLLLLSLGDLSDGHVRDGGQDFVGVGVKQVELHQEGLVVIQLLQLLDHFLHNLVDGADLGLLLRDVKAQNLVVEDPALERADLRVDMLRNVFLVVLPLNFVECGLLLLAELSRILWCDWYRVGAIEFQEPTFYSDLLVLIDVDEIQSAGYGDGAVAKVQQRQGEATAKVRGDFFVLLAQQVVRLEQQRRKHRRAIQTAEKQHLAVGVGTDGVVARLDQVGELAVLHVVVGAQGGAGLLRHSRVAVSTSIQHRELLGLFSGNVIDV